MSPEFIFICVATIVIGVAIIAYTLLRTPKTPASIGTRPSIDLGEATPDEAETETDAETDAETSEEMASEPQEREEGESL